MAWVYVHHPDLDTGARVQDEPGVVESLEARGWVVADMPPELDPDAPNVTPEPEPEPDPKPAVKKAAATKKEKSDNG